MAAQSRRLLSIEGLLAVMVVAIGACPGIAIAQSPMLPAAVAYDTAGNLYIADRNRNEVFEVSTNGVLTVLAGNSVQGFAGDGGPAASAELNAPQGVAVGTDGTVYVADTNNHRIRAVANGIIQTVAGTGVRGFSGDGASALNAQLNTPTCVAIDARSALLICDTGNERIRAVTAGSIATLAGSGVQGYSGDGSPAVAAELNAPRGVASDSTGNVFIADTLNQRVREVGVDGIVSTIAGNGSVGFSGDNGPAVVASLSLPTAVSVDDAGDVFIADTGNERIREVTPGGTISTVAGNGVQSFSADGTTAVAAALNQPLAMTLNAAGNPVFSDSQNSRVRMVTAGGQIATLLPVQTSAGSQTSLSLSAQAVYGTAMATVTVTTTTSHPTGTVEVLAGKNVLAQATLQNGAATLSLGTLAAGTYQVNAVYLGDATHAPSASTPGTLTVTPALVTATAASASSSYGQVVPSLTGTESGLLAQDSATTSVQFSTSATTLSNAGTYPIVAMIVGASSANYQLALGPTSGVYTVLPAATAISLQTPTAVSYTGFPVVLSAQISSNFASVGSGLVQFFDAGTLIATVDVTNGTASTTYTPSASGPQSLSASYTGSMDFSPSSSAPLAISTAPLPDFNVTTTAGSMTVQGGLPATYSLNVASSNGAFTGLVTFAIAGLPKGATVVFNPAVIVPGTSGGTTTLTIQTVALSAASRSSDALVASWAGCCVAFMLCARRKRKIVSDAVFVFVVSCGLLAVSGCGARTVDSLVAASQTSPLTITATSTNLAGTVVSHTLALTLVVE